MSPGRPTAAADRLSSGIATLCGIGSIRPAPGTVASLVVLPVAWVLMLLGGRIALVVATTLATGAGVWASGRYARTRGEIDPSACVVDEVAGQWLASCFAALTLKGFVAAFLLFRVFDIFKPWPISAAEKLPGGYGIMADDLVAALAAGLGVFLLQHYRIV